MRAILAMKTSKERQATRGRQIQIYSLILNRAKVQCGRVGRATRTIRLLEYVSCANRIALNYQKLAGIRGVGIQALTTISGCITNHPIARRYVCAIGITKVALRGQAIKRLRGDKYSMIDILVRIGANRGIGV